MERPDIGISYEEGIPSEIFNNFISIMNDEELNIMLEERERSGPWATYEWFIPTAVIIYISKSYFDSFLKEMGKDHYHVIKKGLGSLRKKLVGEEAPKVTIISTVGKVSGDNKYSLVFSVMAESGNEFGFKLLIQTGVSEGEYEKIISSFIEFLDNYHASALDESTMINIETYAKNGRIVLCAYDFDSDQLQLLNPTPRKK